MEWSLICDLIILKENFLIFFVKLWDCQHHYQETFIVCIFLSREFFLIEIELTYNIILVSDMQHESTFVYIVN